MFIVVTDYLSIFIYGTNNLFFGPRATFNSDKEFMYVSTTSVLWLTLRSATKGRGFRSKLSLFSETLVLLGTFNDSLVSRVEVSSYTSNSFIRIHLLVLFYSTVYKHSVFFDFTRLY